MASSGANFGNDSFASLSMDVAADDACSLSREGESGRFAHAAAGSGDYCDFSIEFTHKDDPLHDLLGFADWTSRYVQTRPRRTWPATQGATVLIVRFGCQIVVLTPENRNL